MTDSTLDGESDDGELGLSTDELFGAVADASVDEASGESEGSGRGEADRRDVAESEDVANIADRTAAEVFSALREEADGAVEADEVLVDESPEDIIESPDDPADEPEIESDLFDEEAFEELILSGRRKEDEFLWVEAGGSESAHADPGESTSSEPDASEADRFEAYESHDATGAASSSADREGFRAADADPTDSDPDQPDGDSTHADADLDSTPIDATDPVADVSLASEADPETEGAVEEVTALVPRADVEPDDGDDEPSGVLGRIRSMLSLPF